MPTKNEVTIEWGSGTLYFYPPEGGDPVPVGPVKDMTETVEREYQDHPVVGLVNTSMTQTVTFEAELPAINLPAMWRLTGDPIYVAKWAMQNHPRLVHLYLHAKTARRRKKNGRRVWREFLKEAYHGKG
jgi:hypothetical protein